MRMGKGSPVGGTSRSHTMYDGVVLNILDIDVKQQFVWYGNFWLKDHEVVLDLSQNLFVG